MQVSGSLRTQEIVFAHNPKVYNPRTREWLILARENTTGQLAWVSTSAGAVMNPPPDHIYSVGAPTPPISNGTVESKAESSPGLPLMKSESEGSPSESSERSGIRQTNMKRVSDRTDSFQSIVKRPQPKAFGSGISSAKRCYSFDEISLRNAARSRQKRAKLKKPKHPKTGYNFFQLSVRNRLCREIPVDSDRVLHNEKVARIIGQRWKGLSAQERKVFQDMAERDKVRYEVEIKAYVEQMHAMGGNAEGASSTDSVPSLLRTSSPTNCKATGLGGLPKIKEWSLPPKVRFVTSARSFDGKEPSRKRPRTSNLSSLKSAKSFDVLANFQQTKAKSQPPSNPLSLDRSTKETESQFDVSTWLDDVFDDKPDDWTDAITKSTDLLMSSTSPPAAKKSKLSLSSRDAKENREATLPPIVKSEDLAIDKSLSDFPSFLKSTGFYDDGSAPGLKMPTHFKTPRIQRALTSPCFGEEFRPQPKSQPFPGIPGLRDVTFAAWDDAGEALMRSLDGF
mmetsp:Transcript_5370/g.10537  ORF Transcript_5370/g.10537 Transcript_5370/m.10537 type:complete len:509 (-) Transcript_5370:400-1926(-)